MDIPAFITVTDSSNTTRTWSESWSSAASQCHLYRTYRHYVSHSPPCVVTTDDRHCTPVDTCISDTCLCVNHLSVTCAMCYCYQHLQSAGNKLFGLKPVQCLYSPRQDGLLFVKMSISIRFVTPTSYVLSVGCFR